MPHCAILPRVQALSRSTELCKVASRMPLFRQSPPIDSPTCPRHGASRRVRRARVPGIDSAPCGPRIVVLDGDQTGQELLEQSLRVLDPERARDRVELERFDLSLENRRATDNERLPARPPTAMARDRARAEGGDDHPGGRRRRRQPEPDHPRGDRRQGDRPDRPADPGRHPGRRHPPSDLRLPDGGRRRLRRRSSGASEEDGDEIAYRTERISAASATRSPSTPSATAEQLDGRVYGGPKWTVSPVYEGMLKEEMDAAAERHPEVAYEPVLIDATSPAWSAAPRSGRS